MIATETLPEHACSESWADTADQFSGIAKSTDKLIRQALAKQWIEIVE
jgi:hypothetical protein